MSKPITDKTMSWRCGQYTWDVDPNTVYDITIPLHFSGHQPAAFGLPAAEAFPFCIGDFVGSLQAGGVVNCYTVHLSPHGNGTHTETAHHIEQTAPTLSQIHIPPLLLCAIITVPLRQRIQSEDTYVVPATPEDQWITRNDLAQAAESLWIPGIEALILRTLPNDEQKQSRSYSGQHPGYLSLEAMAWINEHHVQHLLVDLPSVDRESDEGKLAVHRLFWQNNWTRTITEMVYVDNTIQDGLYLLNLQVPRFCLDAAPSRPVLFPLFPVVSS